MSLTVAALLFIITTISCCSALFVCPKNYCAQVECEEVINCSGANKMVKRGGFCSCCDVCYTILGENEPCEEQIVIGGPPSTVICDENLICHENTCQKVENVIKKQ